MANYKLNYTGDEINALLAKINNLNLTTEKWTFTLKEGGTVTKEVYALTAENTEEPGEPDEPEEPAEAPDAE
jgi:hypothetical protein